MSKIHSCYFVRGDLFTHNGVVYTFGFHDGGSTRNGTRYDDFRAHKGSDWLTFRSGLYESEKQISTKDRLLVFWQTVITPTATVLLILFWCLSFYLMTVRESGSEKQKVFWFGTSVK